MRIGTHGDCAVVDGTAFCNDCGMAWEINDQPGDVTYLTPECDNWWRGQAEDLGLDIRTKARRDVSLAGIVSMILLALAAIVVISMYIVLTTKAAKAADQSYCVLWAREAAHAELVSTKAKTTNDIVRSLSKHWSYCLLQETDWLPLPHASRTDAWVTDMRRLLAFDQGTAPAIADDSTPKTAEISQPGSDEDWERQCRREYRTFRVSDGTVVRHGGGGKRVKCPCGDTVACGG